mgnify:CR=1 FL=1
MKVNAVDRDLNGRSTTMRWLREHAAEAEQRQWDIMNHNAAAAVRLIERVATLPPERRMVRLGSEMLQGYTEKDWQAWWQRREIQDHLEKIFAPIGETARRLGVRLSFHPGQFCVLASDNPGIVERSIEEFEYHADMARWMGYGKEFQDYKINVHISGRQGPEGRQPAHELRRPRPPGQLAAQHVRVALQPAGLVGQGARVLPQAPAGHEQRGSRQGSRDRKSVV